MKVFVVMGNDFPDCVFSTDAAAEEYCEHRREDDRRRDIEDGVTRHFGGARIYWRVYPFEVIDHIQEPRQ